MDVTYENKNLKFLTIFHNFRMNSLFIFILFYILEDKVIYLFVIKKQNEVLTYTKEGMCLS